MHIATGIAEVVTFQATPEELEPTMEKHKVLQERVASQKPVVFGVDVIGDMGVKVRFIGEPEYKELGDTLVECTVHTKVTINKHLAAMIGQPTEIERDFTAWAKCSDSDKESYDFDFGCRIALNKAKINAYSFYQRMFIRIIERVFKHTIMMVGFTKKMESLVNGNAKYIYNICEEMYPTVDEAGPSSNDGDDTMGDAEDMQAGKDDKE